MGLKELLALLALLSTLNKEPDYGGRAAHYADFFEGRLTRNEETFRQSGLTGAVDNFHWKELEGKNLLVCRKAHPWLRCVKVRINDTGRLARAGILVDLSKTAFSELASLELGIVEIRAWVLD